MNIAFDATPLVSDRITGIGWCEIGQTHAIARLHPENSYCFNYFTGRNALPKKKRLAHFNAGGAISENPANFSATLYKAVSCLVPVPYSVFFGKNADITHFFNYIAPHGVKGKTVITVHDMVYKAFPETVRARTKFMLDTGLEKSLKRADIVVTDSEFSRSEIVKYFPNSEAKIRVVPCGVNLKQFRPCRDPEKIAQVKKSLNIDGDYFLYLGTIEPRKNISRLIDAYKIFSQKIKSPPKLVLAGGKGWLCDDILKKAESLSGDVLMTDYVRSSDLAPLMSGSIAFTFPSLYEGFGLPPLEAMACGTPVLVSSEASLPEVTADCAVVCDALSPDSIADGLFRLYDDENLRKTLSQKGLVRAKSFSWSNSAEILFKVYRELV